MPQNIYKEAEKKAKEIRQKLRLGETPIHDIVDILENQGIFVVQMPVNGNGLSGAFLYDKQQNLSKVLINSNRSKGHQIFTAAHEFCHFLFDQDKQIIIDDDKMRKSVIEKRADYFAAIFLMPKEGLNYYIEKVLKLTHKKIDDQSLVKIRNKFKVSWQALIYRLHNLGYSFNKPYKEKILDTHILNSLSIQSGFNAEKSHQNGKFKLPTDFYNLAFKAYYDKKISLNRLAELIRKSYDETKDWIADIEKTKNEGNKP